MLTDPILGAALSQEIRWKSTDDPLRGDMAKLVANQWDINKLAHYLPIYESSFGSRHHPVRMLEIGVSFGGSLELWRKYFTNPDSVIVGLDSNPKCSQFDAPEHNVHVRIGKQQDTEFLHEVVQELGPFDIILDDGSHIPSYTLKSFQYLFADGLRDGGAYLVEDLHTCYAQDCREPFIGMPDANDGSPQFIAFIKLLIDVMHAHYLQTPTGDGVDKLEPGNPAYQHEFQVPTATRLIRSIEIHDAIAVIRRGPRDLPRMIRRWSREKMTSVLNEDAAKYLDDHPHLGEADISRRDWLTQGGDLDAD